MRQELLHLDEATVASDLMGALGCSTAFITMRTDAESVAEVADQRVVRAAAAVYESADHWFEDAARFDLAGLPVSTTIERVLVEGREAFTNPDAVLGTPVPSPDGAPVEMTLAEWEDLPERPTHPLDTIGVDVPWNDDQLLLQYGYDLREASDALRVAVVEWLRAEADRAPHWPGDTPRSPEQIVEDVRAFRSAG